MKLFQNPIFWAVLLFAGGLACAAIGWDKNESTVPSRTTGAIPLMVVGVAGICLGLLIMFTAGKPKQ